MEFFSLPIKVHAQNNGTQKLLPRKSKKVLILERWKSQESFSTGPETFSIKEEGIVTGVASTITWCSAAP